MNRTAMKISAAATVAVTAMAVSAIPAQHADAAAPSHRGNTKTVTIYLTRHGQTILNAVDRVQGWTDSPLVDGARALPVTVGKNIRAREGGFSRAYTADMKRHNETAQLILQGAGQPKLYVRQSAALREINFGKYEGAKNLEMWPAVLEDAGETIDATDVSALMSAMKSSASKPMENGVVLPAEDCTDVNKRMSAELKAIARDAVKANDKRVLVVSSGVSIMCYLKESLGTAVVGGISNVGVSKLEYRNGSWKVLTVNDKSYQS